MKIPGVVWSTALIFLPLLAGYITEFFSGYEWSGAVAGFLTLLGVGLAKVMQERGNEPTEPLNLPPGAELAAIEEPGTLEKPRSLTQRVLFG